MTMFRGDYLLRACVEVMQAAGYTAEQRESTSDSTTVRFCAGAARVRLTHRWRRRCLTVDLSPERTVHRFYQVCAPADLARIAAALADTVLQSAARAS